MHGLLLKQLARVYFAPPEYLALPTAGVDISTNSIKIVGIKEHPHGIEVDYFDMVSLPSGAIVSGEIIRPEQVGDALKKLIKKHNVKTAHVSLPESKSYLFEAIIPELYAPEWRAKVEQHIDEYVPIAPTDVVFDIVPLRKIENTMLIAGVGYAKRMISNYTSIFDAIALEVRSLEVETFSEPRSLLKPEADETVLVVDIGKTTTRLVVSEKSIPRFSTTLGVGGDALTVLIQKHFGGDESFSQKIKIENGIISDGGKNNYLPEAMSVMSVIREEIKRRFDYWQKRSRTEDSCSPVTRVIIVGGSASVRGLPEYLSESLNVPVVLGDVFTNFASRYEWTPNISHAESFAYATSIGLALRDYVK